MKRKLYKCTYPNCETKQLMLIRKMCNYHYHLTRDKKTPTNNFGYKKPNIKRKQVNIPLQQYFEYHLEKVKLNPFCENCGSKIQANICNIAHLIPKRTDSVVSSELENYAYLCSPFDEQGKDCHNKFDSMAGNIKVYEMPFWKIAIKRYLTFRNKCKYNNYSKIFEQWIKINE